MPVQCAFITAFCILSIPSMLCAEEPAGNSAPSPVATATPAGHSLHGEAFNEGPRQRAYLMPGMAIVNFPITTNNELAQKFFNQGIGQLHGFWYFEAERSFRQAAALDPDCAIAYWGMAMANVGNVKRAAEIIKKGVDRKAHASHREALYIDSLAEYYQEPRKDEHHRRQKLVKALEEICFEFPDDLEAKAFLIFQIWDNNGEIPIGSRQAVDALAEQILAANPMHPVHHYRIHLWNNERDQRAIDSAARCGQSEPGIAHMWHMSGHTYSELHRYADAAWQQEASARVDHAHMMRDWVMPDQIHNYAHNNEWCTQDLSHIGRVHDAIDLAKNMIELPRLAKFVTGGKKGTPPAFKMAGTSYGMGRKALFEILDRYELWDDLIAMCQTPYLEPTDQPAEQVNRLRYLGVAYFTVGDSAHGAEQVGMLEAKLKDLRGERMAAAEEAELQARAQKKPSDQVNKVMVEAMNRFNSRLDSLEDAVDELKVYQAIAAGDKDTARTIIDRVDDVPKERLARLYWQIGDSDKAESLAREAAEGTAEQAEPLANYVDILYRREKKKEAIEQFEKLRKLSAQFDLDMPVFKRLAPIAKELNLADDWRAPWTPATDVGQRPDLATLGPFRWQPSAAPTWELPDRSAKLVSLQQFQGKPLVLIFYLGAGCPHCLEQLNEFSPLAASFAESGLSILAVGTESVEGLQDTFSKSKTNSDFAFPILADPELRVFKAYRAYDDFENMPLHGTFLIDGQGRVRWQDVSYEPFKEPLFLLEEAKRLLHLSAPGLVAHGSQQEQAGSQ